MSEDHPAYPGKCNLFRLPTMPAKLIQIAHPGKPRRWYHNRIGLRLWAEPLIHVGVWRVLPGQGYDQGYDGCHVGYGDAWEARDGWVRIRLEEVRDGWARIRLEEVAGPDGQGDPPLDGRLS